MKRIVCEMCGSNKLIKRGGIFECQYCGCQYTLEEARKLLVEGTVKVDESDKVANWMKMADSAFNNSSWSEAYGYYCKVLEVYPDEWRSIYRKALSLGWQSSVGNIHINETLGGVTDAYRILVDSDNTDQFKALGIVSMELEMLTWVGAVQTASVKHAKQFTDRLVQACDEYYQRSALMASVIDYCIKMFDKYAVINIEEINLANNVFDKIISNATSIETALSEEFRVYLGKKYSSFWQASIDEYKTITPPEYANKACSELEIATKRLKRQYDIWKHERVEAKRTREIYKYWEKNPEMKEVYDTLEAQSRILGEQINENEIKIGIQKDELERIKQKISDSVETIAINNNRIERLLKRWIGKQQAIEEAKILEKEKKELEESLVKLNDKREEIEEIVSTSETKLITDKKSLEAIKDKINEIMSIALSN